jgi:molybdopterin synthase catalytic subunit
MITIKPRVEDSFGITLAPLSVEEIYSQVDNPAHGAVVIMSGMVRNQTDGKSVVALEYQAYEPMALQVFYQIADHIRHQWSDIGRVAIYHRIGRLSIGEISVLVAIGCPHRGQAFAACEYAIDTLKHNAPIWKKEHYYKIGEDGSRVVDSSWISINTCQH